MDFEKKKNWLFFYYKMKDELLEVKGNFNLPYLILLQENSKLFEEWVDKTNINKNKDLMTKYSINKFNLLNISFYGFCFDWCNTEYEVYNLLRIEPVKVEGFINKIHQLFDFLLSYQSLLEDSEKNELYYVENKGNIYYESKFPPVIYDKHLKPVYDITPEYCTYEMLKSKKLIR